MILNKAGYIALAAFVAGAFAAPAAVDSAYAQTPGLRSPVSQAPAGAQMLVDADQIVYDYDRRIVTALGAVKIYYNGYTVEADRIVYDENAGRLRAVGRVRLREPSGNIYNVEEFDFSDDFRDGFVRSLLVEANDDVTIAAASAERFDENLTVFNRGVYTACRVCKDKPTFWSVRSARVIYNAEDETIQFDEPTLEFGGVTILRLPSFVAPAPDNKRRSGFLAPTISSSDFTGVGVRVPYYFALAPNYDLTVAPRFYSRQGPMLDADWRHRLETGTYSFRVAGLHQFDPSGTKMGGNERKWRGAVYSRGDFSLSDRFRYGWSGWFQSDPTFLNIYDIDNSAELVRQAYLTGFSERNSFEARVYSFQRQGRNFDQNSLPFVHPTIDYNYIFAHNPLGGELSATVSAHALSRRNFATGSRMTASLDWRNRLITSPGIVIEPFTGVRGDIYHGQGGSYATVAGGLNDLSYTTRTRADILPYVGGTMRYPFVAANSWGTHVVEPIAQIVARPSVSNLNVVNEDAQSLIFDDSNLFELDKFSGNDRREGGTRANFGARYTWSMANGGTLNTTIGQSYHLAGRNPFPGDTGLSEARSDLVGAVFFAPTERYTGFVRVRLNDRNLSMRSFESQLTASYGRLSGAAQYAFYQSQPSLNLSRDRRQVAGSANFDLGDGWSINGNLRYDLVNSLFVSRGIGLSFINECFIFTLNYSQSFNTLGESSNGFNFRLSLRTLMDTGAIGVSENITGFR